MTKSNIEWTEATWNPVVGCSIVSPGCTNCYAMKMAARLDAANAEQIAKGCAPSVPHYEGLVKKVNGNAVWTGRLAQAPGATWLAPLKRRKPTLYFVNSMGDLFHEDCPDTWIDRAFAIMALTPQHTYQVLTKRATRMREYMRRRMLIICDAMGYLIEEQKLHKQFLDQTNPDHWTDDGAAKCAQFPWPLPNVWLGVSAERQQEADARIPELLATPAAARFISAEPLLGPIDLTAIKRTRAEGFMRPLDGRFRTLDWVIVGGESGPGSRPMHPAWARSLRDQCLAAGVPFFFKQWGNWYPIIDRDNEGWDKAPLRAERDPDRYRICNLAGGHGFHGERVYLMQRYGKTAAGRLLDGVLHDAMPAAFGGKHMRTDQLEEVVP